MFQPTRHAPVLGRSGRPAPASGTSMRRAVVDDDHLGRDPGHLPDPLDRARAPCRPARACGSTPGCVTLSSGGSRPRPSGVPSCDELRARCPSSGVHASTGGAAARARSHVVGAVADALGVQEAEQLAVGGVELGQGAVVGPAPRPRASATRRRSACSVVPLLRPTASPAPSSRSARGDLGAGVQRGDDGVGPALRLGAVAERVEVERPGHEAARGGVVDRPAARRARAASAISTSIE